MASRKSAQQASTATIGFEATLWQAADKLRNNMDAGEYKHVVLGLIFLKYISDSFEEMYNLLVQGAGEYEGANPEDADEYRSVGVFWVPKEARWGFLKDHARQPTIGSLIDEAMVAIERDNPRLKGVLPKDYGRPALDKDRLGELVDLVSTIGLGDASNRSKDVLGRVYEYFLTQFASAEGNANFAWVQHFLHHLSAKGKAGFVLANGSMSSNQSGEGEIRQALLEADLIDCMVALPKQLF